MVGCEWGGGASDVREPAQSPSLTCKGWNVCENAEGDGRCSAGFVLGWALRVGTGPGVLLRGSWALHVQQLSGFLKYGVFAYNAHNSSPLHHHHTSSAAVQMRVAAALALVAAAAATTRSASPAATTRSASPSAATHSSPAAATRSASLSAPPFDLTGEWIFMTTYVEAYGFTRDKTDPALFHVVCNQGPCTSWKKANLTAPSVGNVTVHFDNGIVHTGTLDAYGDLITWAQDHSQWTRPSTDPVTIHLVPHSHVDPGWKDTVFDLYNTSVRFIYDAVMQCLVEQPARTYGVEITVFFSMWWAQQNDTTRASVRGLVASGQLEFTGGGWTQNDEAIVRFEDIVDQMTLGHLWAQSAVGSAPITTAWQADPFGHSSGMAFLYTRMVMDGYTFGRPMSQGDDPINDQSGAVWHPSASFPDPGAFDATSLLTRAQTIGYWEPYRSMHGVLGEGNATAAAAVLYGFIQQMTSKKPTLKNVLIMCGDDFGLQDAAVIFPALDATLDVVNKMNVTPKVTVQYSTPARYYKALAAEMEEDRDAFAHKIRAAAAEGRKSKSSRALRGGAEAAPLSPSSAAVPSSPFPTRPSWDMMPLIGCEFPAPWVGFYTSRPEFKTVFHAASAFRRAAQTLHSLARNDSTWQAGFSQLLPLWEAVGLVQHHDAVTGDSYDNVMEDFKSYIDWGLSNASLAAATAALQLNTTAPANTSVPLPSICLNASAALCDTVIQGLSLADVVYISVFNPLATVRDEWVEILVPSSSVGVVDEDNGGVSLPAQVAPAVDTDFAQDGWVVSFKATALPPLGYRTFGLLVIAPGYPGAATVTQPWALAPGAPTTITSGNLSLTFSPNGTLTNILRPAAALNVSATATLLYYSSQGGAENAWDFTTQGQDQTSALPFPGQAAQTATLTSGPLFQEVRAVIDAQQGVSIRYRLYAGDEHARVFSATGPFAIVNNRSVDAVLRITTSLATNGTWATDTNGLEMLPRARNARPWWTSGSYVDSKDPVSSNYYPVTMAATMADVTTKATLALLPVLVSHGVGSLADGELEAMVGRAVVDGSGNLSTGNRHVTVQDALFVHESASGAAVLMRRLASALANPVVLVASAQGIEERRRKRRGEAGLLSTTSPFAPLSAALPPALELLTLQTLPANMNVSAATMGGMEWEEGTTDPVSSSVLLLRLRHIFAAGDDPVLSQPATVDLAALFAPRWTVTGAVELTLTATRTMTAARAAQIQWPQLPPSSSGGVGSGAAAAKGHVGPAAGDAVIPVTIAPMDIRTFVLTIA